MLVGRLLCLGGRREVDVAVRQVDRSTVELAARFGSPPQWLWNDLIDVGHGNSGDYALRRNLTVPFPANNHRISLSLRQFNKGIYTCGRNLVLSRIIGRGSTCSRIRKSGPPSMPLPQLMG